MTRANLRLTLLGVGAMNSLDTRRRAGLLVAYCNTCVMVDGGQGAEPRRKVKAWLVTDLRGELIVKDKIEAALKRSAELDARRIRVEADDGKVTLSGNVHTWFEKDEAASAAWAAPGVTQVSNQIAVMP